MNVKVITIIPVVAVIHIPHILLIILILLIRIQERGHLYGISAESDTILRSNNQIKQNQEIFNKNEVIAR